jgi:tetratricopeptide repeat protein/NB-ARC domain-containing protein
MSAVGRKPTPPGPITDLFDRLHELHLSAGLPSMREIATGIGRGHISSSTIHNMFRGPRVPRWSHLELVVKELQGNPADFRNLWQAARVAEETIAAQGALLDTAMPAQGHTEPLPRAAQRIWSNEIPHRNLHFTGRAAELAALSANLTGGPGVPAAQVISGMGGIGKTEIVTEYIHRHIDQYEIIWWIRAEHYDRVRDALVKLGQRLDPRQAVTAGGRDRTISAVLEALESELYPSWLLVYDNVAQALDVQRYMPACRPGGHVIVTSRLQNWPSYMAADDVRISPFTEAEAVSFLRRRVPDLAAHENLTADEDTRRSEDAGRLAGALGYLPIAVEHAAAYLTETGLTVEAYLNEFEKNPRRLLSEQPADLSAPVSATWVMSTALLTMDAGYLFHLCAFFSPEPVAAELFLQNAHAVSGPAGLGEFLSSPSRFREAANQLHRLSLARVDGARDQIQMHRVVQAVTRGELQDTDPDLFDAYRAAVETLLAESNPRNPDLGSNDPVYDLSLQHLESDPSFLDTAIPALRQLVIDQVRRLHLRGGQVEAVQFGTDALRVWRNRLGQDDLQVLTLAVEVAIALRFEGRTEDARQLTVETLALLENGYGGQHEVTLLCANNRGNDLRDRGQFGEALDLDRGLVPKFEAVFGPDHARTLNVRNNLAEDYRRLGRFGDALILDQGTYEGRLNTLGSDDLRTLFSHDAMARDLRGLGRYQESLDISRRVVGAFARASGRENSDWLYARTGFAAALRKSGHYWDALQESEDVVQHYRDYLGPDHPETLRAAANLINDRRAVGYLARAEELGREVDERCLEADLMPDIGYAAKVNLGSVLRAGGFREEARKFDLRARSGLIKAYGELHPFSLLASINYASDLAACGELAAAIRYGQAALDKCADSLGPEHPDTLVAASNLALDRAAAGDQAEAERLVADVLRKYEKTLTAGHPVARAAANRTRITAEIELY